MAYTVGEMARRMGVPASTIRYYDKEGLLPFVGRSSGGIRVFTEKDFEWLRIIECLKKTGMSLKDIREYIELAMQGDETIARRLGCSASSAPCSRPAWLNCSRRWTPWTTSAGSMRPPPPTAAPRASATCPTRLCPRLCAPCGSVCAPPRRRRQKKYDPKTPPLQKGAAFFCAPGVPTITTHPAKILPLPLYLVMQRTIRHQTKRKISKNPAAKC